MRVTAAVVFLGIAGCSECCNDQDCAALLGRNDHLCIEGRCQKGDPPDEAPTEQECDVSAPQVRGGCPAGQACADGFCHLAPDCLRVESQALDVLVYDGVTPPRVAPAVASSEGCEVTFGFDDEDVTVDRIEIDGRIIVGDNVVGRWVPALRAGVMTHGVQTLVLSEGPPCLVDEIGTAVPCTEPAGCLPLGEVTRTDFHFGVCR